MEFRPCIDIHNGKVKQIVGGSLRDRGDEAVENFVGEWDAAGYAKLYKSLGISGGHVIMLNPPSSQYYEETKREALSALRAFPMGLQAGGGITPENAAEFLNAGASHVIVTSYVFYNGRIDEERLSRISEYVGKKRLVLDLSAGKANGEYRVFTDRWQKITDERLDLTLLNRLSLYCDEFLIHGVDAEGKSKGVDVSLVELLGDFDAVPVTYAGGVHNFDDLNLIKVLGKGHVNVTIGSALDLFGGDMELKKVLENITKK